MKIPKSAFFFAFLILFGIGCRFYNLAWDGLGQFHPDERFCNDVAGRIRFGLPFFDSRTAPLNPLNVPDVHYVYGQLPLFLQKIAALVFQRTDPLLLGRYVSAIFDCLTVLLTFLIARRVFSVSLALFAASLVSLSALHVQHAHFFVTDPFAATFLTASFWALMRFHDENKPRDAALCGAFWGFALACKVSSFLFGPVLLIAFVMAAWKYKKDGKAERIKGLLPFFVAFILCLIAAIVCFRMGNPMAFRGEGILGFFDLRPEERYVLEVQKQLAITRGIVDVPFNAQWIGTPKWWFSLQQLGNWGYSWGFLISGSVGLLFLFKKREPALILAAVGAIVLLGVQGAQFSKFTRYYLPLTPLLALLAAFFWREMMLRKPVFKYGVLGVSLWAFGWCWAVTGVWSQPHTLRRASTWIVENIPPKTVIANETAWDLGLPIAWIETGNGNLEGILLDSYGHDSHAKREALLLALQKADWIFQSSGRSWQNIPRWQQKWPLTTRFYAALFEGELGFERAREFTSYPQLGPFVFPDDGAEEALSVYDHPRVILWKKRADFDIQNARAKLQHVTLPPVQNWVPKDAP